MFSCVWPTYPRFRIFTLKVMREAVAFITVSAPEAPQVTMSDEQLACKLSQKPEYAVNTILSLIWRSDNVMVAMAKAYTIWLLCATAAAPNGLIRLILTYLLPQNCTTFPKRTFTQIFTGCREAGVSILLIVSEQLLVSWLAVKVATDYEKERRVPPVMERESPFWTEKGRVRATVYVTPRSKGKEKYTVYVVAELVIRLLEVTQNSLCLSVRTVVTKATLPWSTVAPKLMVYTLREQLPTNWDMLTVTLRVRERGRILVVAAVREEACIVLLLAVERQFMLEYSPLPLRAQGKLLLARGNSLGNMILREPFAVIWLIVLKENTQWVLVVPISVFRQETVTLSNPGAAEQEQLCMIREQLPEVPSVSERVQGVVVKGMPTDDILKMSRALSTACDEIELISRLLSYLVRVRVPKPATVRDVATEVSMKAGGKSMESVSVWKRGVVRSRSKRRVAAVCTVPLLMLIEEKVVGCIPLIVMLQESISPISPLLVCVYMLMKLTSGLVEGGILRLMVKEEVKLAWKRKEVGQMEGKLVSEQAGLMEVAVGSSGQVVGTDTKISQLLLALMQEEEQVTVICPSVKAYGLETVVVHRALPPTMVTAAPLEPLSTTEALGERMVMAERGEQSPPGAGLMIFETATEKLEGDRALGAVNNCLTNRTEPEKAQVALAPTSPLWVMGWLLLSKKGQMELVRHTDWRM